MQVDKLDFFDVVSFAFREATWWSILIGCVLLIATWIAVFLLSKRNLSLEASAGIVALGILGAMFSVITMMQPAVFLFSAYAGIPFGVFFFIASLIARKLGAQ